MKEELILFNDFVNNDQKSKRKEVKTENKQRIPKRQDIFQHRDRKSHQEGPSKVFPVFKEEDKTLEER